MKYTPFDLTKLSNPLNGAVFDPTTLIALMGAQTAGTIGSIATIAGPVLQVAGAISAVQAGQAQAAEHERAAIESRVAGSYDAERMRRHSRVRQSRDFASMAEGGAWSGTSLDLFEQNAAALELDALNLEYGAEQRAKGSDFQARQSRTGVLDVFSTAITGFSNMDPLNLAATGGAGPRGVASSVRPKARPAPGSVIRKQDRGQAYG